MKQQIRLTESELRHIISESVKKIVSEISFEKAHAAALKAADPTHWSSDAMRRRQSRNIDIDYRKQQRVNLQNGAVNAFNREYGKNLGYTPYGSQNPVGLIPKHPQKPYYGMKPVNDTGNYDTVEAAPYERSFITHNHMANYEPDLTQSSYLSDYGKDKPFKYYPNAGNRGDNALKNSFNKWHDDYYGYEDD